MVCPPNILFRSHVHSNNPSKTRRRRRLNESTSESRIMDRATSTKLKAWIERSNLHQRQLFQKLLFTLIVLSSQMSTVVLSWSVVPTLERVRATLTVTPHAPYTHSKRGRERLASMMSVLDPPSTTCNLVGGDLSQTSHGWALKLSSSSAVTHRPESSVRQSSSSTMFLVPPRTTETSRLITSSPSKFSNHRVISSGPVLATSPVFVRTPPGEVELHNLASMNKQAMLQIAYHRGALGFDVFQLHAIRDTTSDSIDFCEDEDRVENYDDIMTISGFSGNKDSTTSSSFFLHPGMSEVIEPVSDDPFSSSGLTWEYMPLSTGTKSGTSSQKEILSSTPSLTTSAVPSTFTSSLSRIRSGFVKQKSQILPVWFPWIPTKSQIQSLKVTELKEACVQRGLIKAGNKTDLQNRLWQWTIEQQNQHQARLTGDYLSSWFEEMAQENTNLLPRKVEQNSPERADVQTSSKRNMGSLLDDDIWNAGSDSRTPNSLEDWSRTVDLEKLMNKRQEIHRQKRMGKKPNQIRPTRTDSVEDTKAYLSRLTKAIQASPSSPYASNKEATELYKLCKQADQLGDFRLSVQILELLVELTPNDAKVYRRLARMYREQGDFNLARTTLQNGLRKLPANPWLWHGLGQLEMLQGQTQLGIKCYRRAIKEDPTFAHSYHAWGIHEYSQGHIASAMKILKKGVEYCPTNHRLHHALGDLYRGAKLLRDADRSYRRALREGPPVSHGFAYSALAYVSYEKGDVEETRSWLYKSIKLNDGRHAQGWLALAELEEAEGNPSKALVICQACILQYEKGLIKSRQRYMRERENDRNRRAGESRGTKRQQSVCNKSRSIATHSGEAFLFDSTTNPEDFQKSLLQSVPAYRSGDKFLNVYRHWARLEERYGTLESTNFVHERATKAFPKSYKVTLDWAEYHAKRHNLERARSLFVEACNKASKSHADPYRLFASFEISHGNHQQARKILFRGAQAIAESPDGGLGNKLGLAQLFVTWAVTEWHLWNIARSEILFDHGLRLTEAGRDGSELRSFIFYCIALLEYQERSELYLAQHCIGLCLKENRYPGGNAPVWNLWRKIARDLSDPRLEESCIVQAEKCQHAIDHSSSDLDLVKVPDVESWVRQNPWHEKLQSFRGGSSSDVSSTTSFFASLQLPLK